MGDGTVCPTLTGLEADVLELAATGLTTTEIAQRLDQSPDAVRHALASILRKLGARSKLEALLIALSTGLVRPPSAEA